MLPVSLLRPLAYKANSTLTFDVNRSSGEIVRLHGVDYRLEDVLRLLQDAPLEVAAAPHGAAAAQAGANATGRSRAQPHAPVEGADAALAEPGPRPESSAAAAVPSSLAARREQIAGTERRILRGLDEAATVRMRPGSVALAVIALLLLLLLLCPAALGQPQREEEQPRSEVAKWVEGLQVLSATDVEAIFHARGGYDCVLIQPQEHEGAVRIEGRVELRSPDHALQAPITRRRCVLFSASAGERRLDGVGAPPLAFHAMNADFDIVLGRPLADELRVRVRGQDVALFDMVAGSHEEVHLHRDAPEHLQDFARAHPAAAPDRSCRRGSGNRRPEKPTVVEFRESFLEEGAIVTCVGELRRAATGEIGLWPLSSRSSPTLAAVTHSYEGLTSWETSGRSETRVEKVVVSDDPRFQRGRGSLRSLLPVPR